MWAGFKNLHRSVKKKGRKSLHINSIVVVISAVTSMVAIATALLLFTMLEHYFNGAAVQVSVEASDQIAQNVKRNMDAYMEEMIMLADKMQEILLTRNPDESAGPEFIVREDIDTIAAFDQEGEVLLKSDDRRIKPQVDVKGQTWFQKGMNAEEGIYFTEPHVQRLYTGAYPWVISMVKKGVYHGREVIILVDMNFKNIKELCVFEGTADGSVYIMDKKGAIIFHPNQQMLYAGIQDKSISYAMGLDNETEVMDYDGRSHIISAYDLANNDWSIVSVNELKTFERLANNIKASMPGLVAAVLSVMCGLSLILARFIVRPLKRLMHLMAKAEAGDFSVSARESSYYEIVALSQSFNSMIQRIQKLLADIKREHKLLRKSEMKTLHEQINSHFLYNTLDSVIWMSEVDDKANAIRMLKALSQFFRISLNRGNEMIPVQLEVRHVENYLIIQKMRYGDQFEYEIHMDQEVLHLLTLKMVLQPLVENSILHGLAAQQDEGKIVIRGTKQEGYLLLAVSDNGCGIPEEKLERILEVDPKNKNGVGIKNVNERIQLTFGKEYGLSYYSKPDQGTRVEIRLPALEERKEEGEGHE